MSVNIDMRLYSPEDLGRFSDHPGESKLEIRIREGSRDVMGYFYTTDRSGFDTLIRQASESIKEFLSEKQTHNGFVPDADKRMWKIIHNGCRDEGVKVEARINHVLHQGWVTYNDLALYETAKIDHVTVSWVKQV